MKVNAMTITTEKTAQLVKKFGGDAKNTGSSEAQVAILSERIANLTEHFKTHSKDHHSRRGLLRMVSTRRRLLAYIKKNDEGKYQGLIKELGLRK